MRTMRRKPNALISQESISCFGKSDFGIEGREGPIIEIQHSRTRAVFPKIIDSGDSCNIGVKKLREQRHSNEKVVALVVQCALVNSVVLQGVVLIELAKQEREEVLCPDDTVDELRGLRADCADGIGGRRGLGVAVEALTDTADMHLTLAKITSSARLNQRHVGHHAHSVDVAPSGEVVEGIHHESETAEVVDVEAALHHIGVVGSNVCVRIESHDSIARPQRLTLVDVGAAKEKLAIEVRVVNRVEINLCALVI